MALENPHLKFPLERAPTGGLKFVEQDSPEDVGSAVSFVVRCPAGWRPERPEFGWDFPEFRNVMNLAHLRDAIVRHEPRADPDVYEKLIEDLADPSTREISQVSMHPQGITGMSYHSRSAIGGEPHVR